MGQSAEFSQLSTSCSSTSSGTAPLPRMVLTESLIDARLLTSYEVPSDDGPGRQRVEVIHESLLRAWPRLVRWQAQDAEGALLRDQLRQAARTWDEHQRSDDLLWTGSAYREFSVWRESYPGGLTDLEEEFARETEALRDRFEIDGLEGPLATGCLHDQAFVLARTAETEPLDRFEPVLIQRLTLLIEECHAHMPLAKVSCAVTGVVEKLAERRPRCVQSGDRCRLQSFLAGRSRLS